MTRKARLSFSKAARSDLLEMRRYSLERYGRAVATRYVNEVEAAFRLKRRHRVFYRIKDDAVHILRVLQHAMDAGPAIDSVSSQ